MNKHQQGVWRPDPDPDDRLEQLLEFVRAQQPRYEEVDPGPTFDLRAIFGLVRRQIWTILGVTVVGVGIAALYLTQVERQYTATTSLVVDTQASEMVGGTTGLSDALGTNSVISTEVEIAKSTRVLTIAAERLELPSSPVVAEEGEPPVAWADLDEIEASRWAATLGEHIQVAQRGATNVITISATTPSPSASALWANAVAEAYRDFQIESKVMSQDAAIAFFQAVADRAQTNVLNLDQQIDAFVRTAVAQAGSPEAQRQLAELQNELGQLGSRQSDLSAITDALDGEDAAALARLVGDDASEAAADLTNLQAELQAETDAARAAQIQADIASLEQQIRAAALERTQALQAQIATQEEAVDQLQTTLNSAATQRQLPSTMVGELLRLQNSAELFRTSYRDALSRLGAAEQQRGLALPYSTVIAEAIPPESPSYPSVRTTLLMAFLLAGAAGVGLALLREQFIGGITSPEQLEQAVGLPVVAAIPRHKMKDQEPDWAIVDEPLSAFSEAIRRARIGIESVAIDRQVRLAVTSSSAGEGKTTIALALARSFAKAGRSTILVDADLRHPSVRKHLNLDVKFGLIDYLLSGRSADTAHMFIMKEEETGLSMILGSEPATVATDSLVLSDRFSAVVEYCSRDYEVVIFDTPPVGIVVDPQILTRKHATVCLYVVKAEGTPIRAVRAGLKNLALSREVPIVSLLNQVSARNRYYAKYNGEYYSQ